MGTWSLGQIIRSEELDPKVREKLIKLAKGIDDLVKEKNEKVGELRRLLEELSFKQVGADRYDGEGDIKRTLWVGEFPTAKKAV